MGKFIIVAGSPNSGKTITVNLVVNKLIDNGYKNIGGLNDNSEQNFWEIRNRNGEHTTGGSIILERKGYKIILISYGDNLNSLEGLFNKIKFDNYDAIICCSHATRGKNIFEFFHEKIRNIDLNKTKVIPIYKNLLANNDRNNEENEFVSNLIVDFLQK